MFPCDHLAHTQLEFSSLAVSLLLFQDFVVGDSTRMDMNSLPDDIIRHIVSFLSVKEVAFASCLSKRWRNLFTIIPNLEFDDSIFGIQESLMDFLDAVSALPLNSLISNFSLNCHKGVDPTHYAQVNRCLCNVLKLGVMDFKLDIKIEEVYRLPFEVFTCKTIVELKLGTGLVIDVLPENSFLPALKTLFLDSVRFYDHLCGCAFRSLLSACPVLKELTINNVNLENWKWSRIVSSLTLQRLTIKRQFSRALDEPDVGSITFDTPSLVYLEYIDYVADDYPIVNLESLVEAKLDLTLRENCVPTNLFTALRNVEKLSLLSTFETFYYFHEAIPVFEKLHHLTIAPFRTLVCCYFLPFLLKKSPKLETLVIEGPLHTNQIAFDYVCRCMSGYSFLLSCPIKILEISEYEGTVQELEQLRHYLGKLPCLELVKVRVQTKHAWVRLDYEEKLRITTNLLWLPRASSKCEIKIEFL